MNCPKCKAGMDQVVHDGHEIERCTKCGGLWFDLLEREELKKVAGSQKLDSGDPKVGAAMNRVDEYTCPKCAGAMIHMVDREQKHVWYEACSRCYGVYFDAGEFKDYKLKDLRDRVRSMLTPERKPKHRKDE